MIGDVPLPDEAPDPDDDTDVGTYEAGVPPWVHAGRDVDQSEHLTQVSGDLVQAGRDVIYQTINNAVASILKRRHTTAKTLAEQLRRFQAPDGLEEMAWRLATDRVVVLLCPAAERHCGQRATAAYLVDRINTRGAPHAVLDFQEPETEGVELEESVNSAADVAFFFDFAGQGSSPATTDRLRQLGVLEARLPEAGCVAVMAIPDDLAEEAHKQFPGRTYRLGKPSAEQVFRAHADRLHPSLTDVLVTNEWVRKSLHDVWPPRAARLAKLAVQAHDSGITDAADIVQHLRGALSDWREEAREELRRCHDAASRALLLAVSMLEGSAPLTIVAARDLLLRTSRFPVEPINVLERTDVVTELRAVGGAALNADTTRFTRAGFGTALLHLAWRDYPGLRPVLIEWLNQLPSVIAARTVNDLDGLTQRVVALAARDNSGQIAVEVARRWTRLSPRPDAARRAAAVLLLRDACLHTRIGRDMRHRVYEHSYYGSQSARFRAALAEAVGWWDVSHQAAAMTRLKHLARGPENEVITAVVEAVVRLSGEMDIGQFLRYLADWFRAGDPRRAEVAAEAATRAMSGADVARTGPGSATAGLLFWRRSLDCLPAVTVAGLVQSYLRLAGTSPDRRSEAVQVLCRAAGSDLRRVGQLFYATRPLDPDMAGEGPLDDLFQQVRLQLDGILPTMAGAEEDI
ncbi:hypothetical protein Ait01nite_004820 [Actinoplanes italicus]|uniref:Uncharacterized protein n=1 Tax=Actinoplanes italicus TaxID=113567 RepID=A0A2T0KMH5_9ACTN|nr:hypothetical protein [Actinoplanes italicus]PRX24834.1 hypothetical protein CLV67_102614 [Actinoplanes italicus]GIE27437.1 hypothetical protein Ait01nite_004820 [Actinoplanes italicus]